MGTLENDVRRAALFLAVLLCGVLPPVATFGAQAQAALQRAAALVQEGRLQEADQQAQLALSDPATRAAACSVLGAIRVRQDRLEEGAELLQEAIRLDPGAPGPYTVIGQILRAQGDLEGQKAAFAEAARVKAKREAEQKTMFDRSVTERVGARRRP